MRRRTSIVAMALTLAGLAAACGKPATTPGAGGTYGADELILRVETAGGFLPRDYALRNTPEFTLLGDGRVFTPGAQIEIFPPPAVPPLQVKTLTEDAVARILEEAEAAGLTGPDKHYDYTGVADAGTTTFILIDADGKRHKISAYALGMGSGEDPGAPGDDPVPSGEPAASDLPLMPGTSAEDREAREKLAKFRQKLFSLGDWLPKGSVGEDELYAPDAWRIFVLPYPDANADPSLKQEEKAWPLSKPLSEFGDPYEGPQTRCGVVDGPDLDTLREPVEKSNTLTPWTSGGKRYQIVVRPLLPDESGCPSGS